MSILVAENNFKKGLAALVDDNHVEAAVFFRRALDVERQRHVRSPNMRYLSYYGLCLAKTNRPIGEAIHACRTAVRRETGDPELYLNLGRVFTLARRLREARETVDDGLKIAPDHDGLRNERDKISTRLGLRGGPVRRRRAGVRGILRRLTGAAPTAS
ncbi:MAG: tetratricopeptide repeat protein [Acidobacteriota bacterium]|nr:tetratricopeptide repeat protein [Acidobacteriota bacterium]MDH3784170.1 tetratricopeptide repeat protein [Acidobacteriota bacterium]